MYSIVLMLAVSGSPAAPAWQGDEISVAKRYGDSGHYQYRHRRGGSYGGCYGNSGCCGGYYGGGCTGGYYGGYGQETNPPSPPPRWRSRWRGNNGGYYGSYGCCGGSYGAGCYGSGCSGGYYGNGNGKAMPRTDQSTYYGSEGAVSQANDRATIIVHMPAEAKLTIDDEPTKSTSGTRTFVSPALEQGKEFHYTLKAEINKDGKMTTKAKTIAVKAGQKTEVDLNAADDSGKAAEPKPKSGQGAEPKSNANPPAQPKANPDQGAQPKAKPDQGAAQPKADQGAQPKPNSNQQAQPQP